MEYGAEPVAESTGVVNPAWWRLDPAVGRRQVELVRRQARCGVMSPPVHSHLEQAAE